MKTSFFIFFTATIIYIIPKFVQAAVTGSQCQSHLAKVTDILKRENLNSYWSVNDEIPNVLGTPLNQLADFRSQDPDVDHFVNTASTTISECQSQCGGIIKKNGKKLSCEELKNKTVLDVINIIKNIEGHFVSEETESSTEAVPVVNFHSPCSNGWETDSCQIFIDTLQIEEDRITAKAILASSTPECANGRLETDSCKISLDQIFHRESSLVFTSNESIGEDSLR